MILQKKEELANRQLRLTITVERDAWEKALNDAYQEVKALYPVEGYAVGKAPREALEKAYSHDLFYQEAVNETFPAALVEAIASEDIQIAAPPALNVETIGPDGYTFTALIDLYPEVKLGQYKGLSAPWENAELSDDDTNEAIQRFLTEHLVEQEQNRAAMGDEVTLDFEGFVDGVPSRAALPRAMSWRWAPTPSFPASRSRWRAFARRRSGMSTSLSPPSMCRSWRVRMPPSTSKPTASSGGACPS